MKFIEGFCERHGVKLEDDRLHNMFIFGDNRMSHQDFHGRSTAAVRTGDTEIIYKTWLQAIQELFRQRHTHDGVEYSIRPDPYFTSLDLLVQVDGEEHRLSGLMIDVMIPEIYCGVMPFTIVTDYLTDLR